MARVCVGGGWVGGGGGGGGGTFHDKFVYIYNVNIVCFHAGCFKLECEMYTPRAHLITGALSDPTINNNENYINIIIIAVLMAD